MIVATKICQLNIKNLKYLYNKAEVAQQKKQYIHSRKYFCNYVLIKNFYLLLIIYKFSNHLTV